MMIPRPGQSKPIASKVGNPGAEKEAVERGGDARRPRRPEGSSGYSFRPGVSSRSRHARRFLPLGDSSCGVVVVGPPLVVLDRLRISKTGTAQHDGPSALGTRKG